MARPSPAPCPCPGVPDDHILVVVQLSGGNDGLNTVVPYGSPEYYKARPPDRRSPRTRRPEALGSATALASTPRSTACATCTTRAWFRIVQGVGYPNPNRSHFKSMDIWHTADTTATGDGWLGRTSTPSAAALARARAGEGGTERNRSRRRPARRSRSAAAHRSRCRAARSSRSASRTPSSSAGRARTCTRRSREPYDHINRAASRERRTPRQQRRLPAAHRAGCAGVQRPDPQGGGAAPQRAVPAE